jgi:hypothetical protein
MYLLFYVQKERCIRIGSAIASLAQCINSFSASEGSDAAYRAADGCTKWIDFSHRFARSVRLLVAQIEIPALNGWLPCRE